VLKPLHRKITGFDATSPLWAASVWAPIYFFKETLMLASYAAMCNHKIITNIDVCVLEIEETNQWDIDSFTIDLYPSPHVDKAISVDLSKWTIQEDNKGMWYASYKIATEVSNAFCAKLIMHTSCAESRGYLLHDSRRGIVHASCATFPHYRFIFIASFP